MDKGNLAFELFPELPDDELYRSDHWRVVMNMNQARLGSLLVILLRGAFDVLELNEAERNDLWAMMEVSRGVLDFCFAPTHVNYEFRMNRRRHVHLHIVPRYADRVPEFAGLVFPDNERVTSRRMPPDVHQEIVAWLRKGFQHQLTSPKMGEQT